MNAKFALALPVKAGVPRLSNICRSRTLVLPCGHWQAIDTREDAYEVRERPRDAFQGSAPVLHRSGATRQPRLPSGTSNAALGGALGSGPISPSAAGLVRQPSLAAPRIGSFAAEP